MTIYVYPAGCYDTDKKKIIFHSSNLKESIKYLIDNGYSKDEIMVPKYITLTEFEAREHKIEKLQETQSLTNTITPRVFNKINEIIDKFNTLI